MSKIPHDCILWFFAKWRADIRISAHHECRDVCLCSKIKPRTLISVLEKDFQWKEMADQQVVIGPMFFATFDTSL